MKFVAEIRRRSGVRRCLLNFVADQERYLLPHGGAKEGSGRGDRGRAAQVPEGDRDGSDGCGHVVSANESQLQQPLFSQALDTCGGCGCPHFIFID